MHSTEKEKNPMRVACCWLLVACCLAIAGCSRLYPPIAFAELTAPVYLEPRAKNCHLAVLENTPPSVPYEVVAQITSYGNSPESQEKMQSLIKANACELGADAVILLPLQEVDHISSFDTYPDWLVGKEPGLGERTQVQVDRRYSLRQRGFAIAFKRNSK
jgi:hypothetical protein